MSNKTKKLTTIAMLCAISYVVMVIGRIPIVLFLKYDPKDVIITLGGFIFGPLTSVIISVIVSFVEMFTVSDTSIIGCIMNIISTCSFACTAAIIYKKKPTLKNAAIGVIAGTIIMTIIMLLWNYAITPIYMGYPREAVAAMLLPAFLPFNLIKGVLNATITMLIYRPIINALNKNKLVTITDTDTKKSNIGIILVSILFLCTAILFILVLRGII